MQRFVVIVDDSFTPSSATELLTNLLPAKLPYPLWVYFVPISSEWTAMKGGKEEWSRNVSRDWRSRSAMNIEYDLSQQIHCLSIEHNDPSSVQHRATSQSSLTLSASAIHSACSKLERLLHSDPQTVFSLELIWKFPVFPSSLDAKQRNEIHDGLLTIHGAFDRVIRRNLGRIHIVHRDDSNHSISSDVDSEEEKECDLFALGLWQSTFSEHITIWNQSNLSMKAMSRSQKESKDTFNEMVHRIMNPFKLCSVTLEIENKEREKTKNKNDHQPIKSFAFDLFPSVLFDHDHDTYLIEQNNPSSSCNNNCYQWHSMHLLQTIRRRSFPRHLLVSDLNVIKHSKRDPIAILIMPSPLDSNSMTLCKEWITLIENENGDEVDQYDISWIAQFSNGIATNTHSVRHRVHELKDNAFESEDEWMANAYSSGTEVDGDGDDDGDIEVEDRSTNSSNDVNRNGINVSISSKYLLFPVHRERDKDIVLIAHRILDDDKVDGHLNEGSVNGTAHIEADWIHSLLHLTHKLSATLSVVNVAGTDHDQDAVHCNLDVIRSLNDLPLRRYVIGDDGNGKMVHSVSHSEAMEIGDESQELKALEPFECPQSITIGDKVKNESIE